MCAGDVTFAQDKPVKQEQIEQKSPLSGAHMFKAYCAACHGKDAKGNGPIAGALKQAPADLTTLSKRNGGRFPSSYVQDVLRNGVKAPVHGDAEMPVWGPLFRSMDSDPLFMHVRISSVLIYLKSLQVK
jgi:mono/diheme cytochrome c family protein